MVGRAGRPQFDTEGIAVIMTEQAKVPYYDNLMSSKTLIESSLMDNLRVHFNAEISLKTIKNSYEGVQWIQNTFLHQ